MNVIIKPKQSYSREVSRFIKKVLRQRSLLVESNRSKRPEAQMRSIIDKLIPYTNYGFTDRGAATFLLRKQELIIKLITPQSTATLQQFDNLVSEARYLLKYNCRIPW